MKIINLINIINNSIYLYSENKLTNSFGFYNIFNYIWKILKPDKI